MKTRSKTRFKNWKDEYYLKSYELAKTGMEDETIALTLGVKGSTYRKWIAELPALQEALDKGRRGGEKGGVETFQDYVYGRLPPRLKQLWDEIHGDGREEPSTAYSAMDRLRKESVMQKMQMYLYAFISCNFSMTEACRKLGFNRTMVVSWQQRNAHFAEMMQEIHECKKDFFEGALVQLIKDGDTSAILFANRTINRDRGYNDKVEVDHTVTHQHTLKLEELGLPVETMKTIRDAMRERKLLAFSPEVKDAEFEVKK